PTLFPYTTLFRSPGRILAYIGEATANAAILVEERARPVAQPGSMAISIASQPRDRRPQRLHPRNDLPQHPRAGEDEDEGGADEFRDERQRHLLHLGDRLQERDGDADGGRRDQEGPRQLGGDDEDRKSVV